MLVIYWFARKYKPDSIFTGIEIPETKEVQSNDTEILNDTPKKSEKEDKGV